MANPRKFSEKIALHTQKQAEETAKFEQIMKEVSDVTAKPEHQDTSQLLGLTVLGTLEHVPTHTHRESRNRSVSNVGPMRPRAIERRIDTSPYGPYLSPPPDTSWRRTNSDSALHHSAMQGMTGERNENSGSRFMIHNTHSHSHSHNHSPEPTDRPRSSCEVPSSRVPGINIYPSAQEPGTIQIPIGNNTGSLPDLTSVHFPSPMHTPLDQEGDHSSSPYSSNHLSVPVNSRYLHHNKGVTLENNTPGLVDGINYSHTSLSLTGLGNIYHQHQCSTSVSSPTQSQAQPHISGPGYRSPLPRPSPQSSPGLGRHSEPSSPAAASPLPEYLLTHAQASLLQHSFEQFSMVDPPNVSYIDTPTSVQMNDNRHTMTDVTSLMTNNELDPSYYTNAPPPLVYSNQQGSLHTTPNTPTSIPDIILTDFSNTTDDLNRQDFGDDLTRQEFTSKDLSNVISGALEAELFPSDESLRSGLGPLDFDGLQMLSDPDMNIISDNAEDHFRLDRL